LRDFFSDRSNRFELPHLTRLTHCAIIIRCSRRRVAASVEMQTSPFLASHKIVAGCTSTRDTSNRSHTHTHINTHTQMLHSHAAPLHDAPMSRSLHITQPYLARSRSPSHQLPCQRHRIPTLPCLPRHLAVLISAQMTPYPRLPNNTGMQAQVLRKSRIERLSSSASYYPTHCA
jgi:hypothetical protein